MPPKSAPVTTAVSKKAPTYPPNQTLYITNLPSSKIQKQDLRLSLYTLFSTYGPVLDVVALKTMKMRGQAHVVFRDLQTASQAMRALDGFIFMGKEMKIQYARSKSDTLSKLDGTFLKPAAAAGEVTSTELQQSIFNAPPSAANLPLSLTSANPNLPKPVTAASLQVIDAEMGDAASPAGGSVAGTKRRRDDESEDDDSEGDAAMEEDSDDD